LQIDGKTSILNQTSIFFASARARETGKKLLWMGKGLTKKENDYSGTYQLYSFGLQMCKCLSDDIGTERI
jgi:hypothetical protein